MQRVKMLSLQAESISQSIRSATQTPTMAGLTVPVQIDIDMTTGCKTTIDSQGVNLYKVASSAFKYLDEVATR